MLSVFGFIVSSRNSNCTNYCWYGYDYRTGHLSDFSVTIPPRKTVTGVVTIDDSIIPPVTSDGSDHYTYIRFYNKNLLCQPFFMHIHYSKKGQQYIDLQGSASLDTYPPQRVNNPFGASNEMHIQFSDIGATVNQYYSFFTDDALVKCNFGSVSKWNSVYKSSKLSSTGSVRIFVTNDNIHNFRYLSVCSNTAPKVCTDPGSMTVFGVFERSRILNCSGSGMPYLKIWWDYPAQAQVTQFKINYDTTSSVDHVISSDLEINNFATGDVGNYTCTIYNEYFRTTDTITYMVYTP